MKRLYRSSIVAVGIILSVGGRAAESEPANHWRAMAETDLQFIHQNISEQHPGPLNTDDPGFARWLEDGMAQARSDLDQVRSYGGYRALLRRFVTGFRDGHLSLSLHLDYRVAGWPGFVMAWRQDAFRVHHAREDLPLQIGDRLLGCDEDDAEALYTNRVLAFYGKPIPGNRYRFAPRMFINNANPLLGDPSICRFDREGETIEVPLQWNWTAADDLEPLIEAASIGRSGPFSSRELDDGGVWLTIPTFGPSGDEQTTLKAMLSDLSDKRDRPYVVVDVRGNGGGSSFWAEAFVRGLHGDAFFESLDTDSEAQAIYRATEENVVHFREILPYIESQSGKDSGFYRYFATLVDGLDQAVKDGQGLYEHREEEKTKEASSEAESLYSGTVFFLTDSQCASACLDFADVVLEIPGVVHVGQPTSADTIYMEVRSKTLPSRNGRLAFATKFYRGRKRGNNEDYVPAHHWKDDIWRTQELQGWIAELASTNR